MSEDCFCLTCVVVSQLNRRSQLASISNGMQARVNRSLFVLLSTLIKWQTNTSRTHNYYSHIGLNSGFNVLMSLKLLKQLIVRDDHFCLCHHANFCNLKYYIIMHGTSSHLTSPPYIPPPSTDMCVTITPFLLHYYSNLILMFLLK